MNKVDFPSYVDDNTPYVSGNGVKVVIRRIRWIILLAYIQSNESKCHCFVKCHLLTSNSDKVNICVDNYNIKSSKYEKHVRIIIDSKLTFNTHVDEICKKAGQKLNPLSRVIP